MQYLQRIGTTAGQTLKESDTRDWDSPRSRPADPPTLSDLIVKLSLGRDESPDILTSQFIHAR